MRTSLDISERLKQASQLLQYRKTIAVSSHIYTKHVNTLCDENVEFF